MSAIHENEIEPIRRDMEPPDSFSSSSSLPSSSSSSISIPHEDKVVKMSATETSPLLAAAADTPVEPKALRMSTARRVLLIATMASAGLLNRYSVQATVIMLPSIGKAFSIPTSRQQMIISMYSVASGSSMLLMGRLADVRGRWGVFLAGATTFSLFALLLPFARSETFLYLLQALQGFSSAATVPSGIGILASTFPPGRERNVAFVAASASTSLGSVLGNIAGGAIGGLLSWEWVFWISAALAAIVAAAAWVLYPAKPAVFSLQHSDSEAEDNHEDNSDCNNKKLQSTQSVDYFGGFLISASLALLQIGLSQGNVDGWANPYVPGLVVASVFIGYIFVVLQLRMERNDQFPLVRLSMFRNVGFSAAFVVVACFFGSFNSFLVFVSMFFQDILKLDMLQTTLRFLPGGIIGGLACFTVAPALSIFRGFHMLIFGLICGIISPLLFALPMSPEATSYSYWARGFPAMCLCISPEIVWPVIGLYVARNVTESDQSLAGAILQAANHVGRGLGIALATAAQVVACSSSNPGTVASLLRGIQAAQWTNVGMAALSLVCTLVFFRGLGRA
ncbi:hypothetical protein PFICI_13476 [Pestalotiopsis fici W106-1]|uniref:Major facilitator superfamily (MFS) profile domain-containing protein n=1 Tax=Pestalotiopsis fici (strain W106-1 / CGMCC3.15140) TaxID=1229662 RepID=W3WPB9_PESFW|nr:uncharacterized protein PFICI_13476 [Pestalotiopsis fici W106-1]ETS74992.1 hypothetical protein PFICI_13476 [Pestalotiopsis fici W106-1]